MNYRMTVPALTALALLMAAGAPIAIARAHDDAVVVSNVVTSGVVDYRSSSWLRDRTVVNNNGEQIASVSDLILDRGWGRIEYVVIKTHSTMGLGGRAIAVPYGSFQWEAGGKDRFVLASTAEQLKLAPEFTPESWTAMKDSIGNDQDSLRQRFTVDPATAPTDPYAGNLDIAKTSRVEGTVSSVDRTRTTTFGEHVVITVLQADGTSKKIALGPSWYVNGASAAPMRGDKVVVETLVLPRDPDQLLAATDLRAGDRELRLREKDGTPSWAMKTVNLGGYSYGTPYSRYLLLSQLEGMKIDCRGNDCGKVNDIILDRNSGEIGFVSIDPNENFLGIDDTKRLIPWSVATVTLDGLVRIDASKEMVLASIETPKELSTLNSGTHAERVYKAFGVPTPRFDVPATPASPTHRPITSSMPSGSSNAWASRGSVISGMESDSAKTIKGRVVEITEVKFDGQTQPARAIKVRTAGDTGAEGSSTEELVILGPVWYLEKQKDLCTSGDPVTIDARRTTIDGKRYWIAKSIDNKDTRVMLVDTHNAPIWDR